MAQPWIFAPPPPPRQRVRRPRIFDGIRFWLLALLLLTAACGRRADLTVFTPTTAPAELACRLDEKGRLAVTVTNQGNRDCKATTTEIVFASLPPVRLPTRPLAKGNSVSVFYPIPEACFAPECRFEVRVDSKNEVLEADEDNNSAAGHCRKP